MINYYLLTKPGIIMGNLITLVAGFMLAARGQFQLMLFLATLSGLSLIMASACVFNNYIDRHRDKKMQRTKNRALVTGKITKLNALMFATILGLIGTLILFWFTNILTVVMAAIGFFVYVVLYSQWKSRTIYGTAIGSVAGAMPTIVGYCAVKNEIDAGAVILFAILVFWQMPHFFSIAIFRFEDYKAAGIPVLPIVKGLDKTQVHMIYYICAFMVSLAMLTLFNYTGYLFLTASIALGTLWLALCLNGFHKQNEKVWGRHMFQLSLIVITLICFIMPFDIQS